MHAPICTAQPQLSEALTQLGWVQTDDRCPTGRMQVNKRCFAIQVQGHTGQLFCLVAVSAGTLAGSLARHMPPWITWARLSLSRERRDPVDQTCHPACFASLDGLNRRSFQRLTAADNRSSSRGARKCSLRPLIEAYARERHAGHVVA